MASKVGLITHGSRVTNVCAVLFLSQTLWRFFRHVVGLTWFLLTHAFKHVCLFVGWFGLFGWLVCVFVCLLACLLVCLFVCLFVSLEGVQAPSFCYGKNA